MFLLRACFTEMFSQM